MTIKFFRLPTMDDVEHGCLCITYLKPINYLELDRILLWAFYGHGPIERYRPLTWMIRIFGLEIGWWHGIWQWAE